MMSTKMAAPAASAPSQPVRRGVTTPIPTANRSQDDLCTPTSALSSSSTLSQQASSISTDSMSDDSTSTSPLDTPEEGRTVGQFAVFQTQPSYHKHDHTDVDAACLPKSSPSFSSMLANHHDSGPIDVDLSRIGLGLSTQESSVGQRRHRIVPSDASSGSSAKSSGGPFAHHRAPSWVAPTQSNGGVTRPRRSNTNDKTRALPPPQPQLPHPSTMSDEVFDGTSQFPVHRRIKASLTPRPRPFSPVMPPPRASSRQASEVSTNVDSKKSSTKDRRASQISITSTLSQYASRADESSVAPHPALSSQQLTTDYDAGQTLALPRSRSNSDDHMGQQSGYPARQSLYAESALSQGSDAELQHHLNRSLQPDGSTDAVFSRRASTASAAASTSSMYGEANTSYTTAVGQTRLVANSGDDYSSSAWSYTVPTAALSSLDQLVIPSSQSVLGVDDAFWIGDEGLFTHLGEKGSSVPALAVSTADEGRDVRVEFSGQTLNEIERELSSKTTHLILAGCRDPMMLDFLERALTVVAPSLLVLDVSRTGLQALPNSVGRCSQLEELNLSGNPITELQASNIEILANLRQTLRLLLLDVCGLTMLPIVLMELRRLRMLSLCNNHLTHIPSWLCRLSQLDHLLLIGNPFQGPWQKVCQPFCTPAKRTIASGLRGRSVSQGSVSPAGSAYGSTSALTRSKLHSFAPPGEEKTLLTSDDGLEELIDPISPMSGSTDNDASEAMPSSATGRSRTMRPFVRRMMSAGDITEQHPSPSTKKESAGGENRWNTFKRKLVKRPSNGALDGNAIDPLQLSASAKQASVEWDRPEGRTMKPRFVRSRSKPSVLSLNYEQGKAGEGERPADKPAATEKKAKRESFLPFGPRSVDREANDSSSSAFDLEGGLHGRHVRSLMQYLADLSDLNPNQHHVERLRSRPQSHTSTSDASRPSTLALPSESEKGASSASSESSAEGEPRQTKGKEGEALATGAVAAPVCKDNAHRRAHIISEIVSTEETYVSGLRELIDLYVLPSAKVDASHQPVISVAENRQVFGNAEGILAFHENAFLPSLRAAAAMISLPERADDHSIDSEAQKEAEEALAVATARAAERMAKEFELHAAYFRMYTHYVNNVDAAQQRVAFWTTQVSPNTRAGHGLRREYGPLAADKTSVAFLPLQQKERKRLRAFLQQARLSPRHSQLSLESYLHLPVQRIPRYRLLFEDLTRVCPPERLNDPHAIVNALTSISAMAATMNESKRQSEMDRRLLQWQDRICGTFPSPLVQPHRKLIHDGALTLRRIVSRVPSFCVARSAVLGDTLTYDAAEEASMMWTADATPMMRAEQQSDDDGGSHSPSHDDELQVYHLEQQDTSQNVQVILCNDIIVIVKGNRDGPVTLFAVLRVAGPARIVNETTLRIVDPKHILYLAASSKPEAQSWQRALDSAHCPSQTSPSAVAST